MIEDLPGGCLVRIGALLNSHADLVPFCTNRQGRRTGPRALQDLDDAVDRAERLIKYALNGLPATRSKGRWRPADVADRQAWGRHLTKLNAESMRAEAAAARGRRTHAGAAVVIARALKAA